MNIQRFLIAIAAVFTICIAAESADAQIFRNWRSKTNSNVWSQPRVVSSFPRTTTRATARPVTGYGTNLHRNFTIRQEQLRTQRTGLPPHSRGNILWAR
ncbi:hypothetical protein OAG71_04500 [bacterium]|nr:hypothetical protein [bacterium]